LIVMATIDGESEGRGNSQFKKTIALSQHLNENAVLLFTEDNIGPMGKLSCQHL